MLYKFMQSIPKYFMTDRMMRHGSPHDGMITVFPANFVGCQIIYTDLFGSISISLLMR